MSSPLHPDPPLAGAGLSHLRIRVWDPAPHVREHVPHTPQLPQFPFTRTTGHLLLPHCLVSTSLPEQGLPPFAGGGSSHDLPRDIVPPPHVTEQSPKRPQRPQFPSTRRLGSGVVVAG